MKLWQRAFEEHKKEEKESLKHRFFWEKVKIKKLIEEGECDELSCAVCPIKYYEKISGENVDCRKLTVKEIKRMLLSEE